MMQVPEKLRDFINGLTREEQDRVLTGKLASRFLRFRDGRGCLIGLAYDFTYGTRVSERSEKVRAAVHSGVGERYNYFFALNPAEAGAAIRQYILDRQAMDTPSHEVEEVSVLVEPVPA